MLILYNYLIINEAIALFRYAVFNEKKKTPVPPIDDKPEKQKKKQENVAPINLEDLYKDKVKVEE